MMHFPPVSDFPPVSETFSDSVENFPKFTFSRKIFRFPSVNISHDPFCHQPQISTTFPPISTKLFFPPYFSNFPPCFQQICVFLHTFYLFRFLPTFTIMHLCITQCTYWTPLNGGSFWTEITYPIGPVISKRFRKPASYPFSFERRPRFHSE